MKSRAAWPSKTHHQKASRKGVYRQKKDIQPAPQCAYVSINFALPVGHTTYLLEKYPNRSIGMAVKAYLLENIHPVDVKEI